MDILASRYGVTRPKAIANRLASLRARFAPVQTEVAPTAAALIEAPEMALQPETRVPFVQLFPHLRESHLKAQRRFYAAIKAANLPLTLSARLAGVNGLLGTSFTSSTQLSPCQLHAVADAIESGRFDGDWNVIEPQDDAPFLVEAPEETETAPEVGTPAPLESLDENAMEFDLSQMRSADRARALNDLRAHRVLLETALIELDRQILFA